jgi:hypothetical protein
LVVAVARLEIDAAGREAEWRLLAQKARAWLSGVRGPAEAAEWLAAARAAFEQLTA